MRAVFLDRDGVINRAVVREGKPYPPSRLDQVEILPHVREALARLKQASFKLVVVTNQPDIARGTTTREAVDAINAHLGRELPLDGFYVCPHDSGMGCDCRKPRPGLLRRAAEELGIDLAASYMVGDRWRDVAAGRAAGCRTFFIDYNYDEQRPESPDFVVGNLADVAEIVLSKGTP